MIVVAVLALVVWATLAIGWLRRRLEAPMRPGGPITKGMVPGQGRPPTRPPPRGSGR